MFPLYFYSYLESAGRTVFLCPLGLYWGSRDTGASFLLTPLLMDRFLPTDGTRHQWLLPVFFRRLWADNEEVLLLPVYYHRHLVDQATGAVHDTTAVVPFYMGTTHVAGDGTLTYARHMLFFPVFRRAYAPGEGAIAYDVLWPLAHYSRTPTSRNVRLLPLAWIYDDSAARGSSWQVARARVFFPLFYSLEMGDGRKLTAFFPFWLKHQGADGGAYLLTIPLWCACVPWLQLIEWWRSLQGLSPWARSGFCLRTSTAGWTNTIKPKASTSGVTPRVLLLIGVVGCCG